MAIKCNFIVYFEDQFCSFMHIVCNAQYKMSRSLVKQPGHKGNGHMYSEVQGVCCTYQITITNLYYPLTKYNRDYGFSLAPIAKITRDK